MQIKPHISILVAIAALLLPASAFSKSATTVTTTTEEKTDKKLKAKPGLTSAEVDEAMRKVAQLAPKMSVLQVEAIVGRFDFGGNGTPTMDILKSLPKIAGIKITASNGIYRFDFVSDAKGDFSLVSWALLPGATPSKP